MYDSYNEIAHPALYQLTAMVIHCTGCWFSSVDLLLKSRLLSGALILANAPFHSFYNCQLIEYRSITGIELVVFRRGV